MMASAIMMARLLTLLLAISVLVRARLPPPPQAQQQPHDKLQPTGHTHPVTLPPFDPVRYKEFLTTGFNCSDLKISHKGVSIAEEASETVFGPTYNPNPPSLSLSQPPEPREPQPQAPSLPPPPANPQTPEDHTGTTRQAGTNPAADDVGKHPEYDDDGAKYHTEGQYEKLPDRSRRNVSPDKVPAAGGHVNGTTPNLPKECTAPLWTKTWDTDFNWYQVLLENGGPPGGFFPREILQSNLSAVLDPCARPLRPIPPVRAETVYSVTHAEFEKVYRTEQARVQLPGTPKEFIDITGQLIWAPPGYTRRYYHMIYRKDDTGLWISVNHAQRCVFRPGYIVQVVCQRKPEDVVCECDENGKESCYLREHPIVGGLPPGLIAALAGGG